jgi:nucleoside-diphosphate-sugar epimerase
MLAPNNTIDILITGAKGFTGKHFINFSNAKGLRTRSLLADITDADSVEKEILTLKPTMVLHLAGISFVPSKDQEAFYKVHALGTGNLLSALSKLQIKPQKILLASSATVYGNTSQAQSIETQTLSPVDHYAISKVAMEETAKTYFDRLPIVIARPFNYTGPGQHPNFLIPKLIEHFASRKTQIELGNLDTQREFNDVEIICGAYLALLQHGRPGEIYNVCTGNARSLQEVLTTLIQITGHNIDVHVNPDFIRSNEIRRMCGNPNKLLALLKDHHIELPIPTLTDTLTKMLLSCKG